MMGIRKVVKLEVYDMPNGMERINKDNNTYQFYWKNKYYIGRAEILRTRSFNNITRKPLFIKRCDDGYLNKMINSIASNDNNPDNNIVQDKDFLFYAGGDSSIYYYGNNTEDIKKKIYKK